MCSVSKLDQDTPKDFFFEAVVTVNLTVMLVLTTMFISVSSNLPTTSYVKMIDIWLLVSLLFPFLSVISCTILDLLKHDYNREINHHGKKIHVAGKEEIEKTDDGICCIVETNSFALVLYPFF